MGIGDEMPGGAALTRPAKPEKVGRVRRSRHPDKKAYACVSSQSSSVYSVAPSAAISINACALSCG